MIASTSKKRTLNHGLVMRNPVPVRRNTFVMDWQRNSIEITRRLHALAGPQNISSATPKGVLSLTASNTEIRNFPFIRIICSKLWTNDALLKHTRTPNPYKRPSSTNSPEIEIWELNTDTHRRNENTKMFTFRTVYIIVQ